MERNIMVGGTKFDSTKRTAVEEVRKVGRYHGRNLGPDRPKER